MLDIQNLYSLYTACRRVSTDTRKIIPGSIFFALKGPNFNANAFAEEAINKGAKYAVIDEEQYKKGDNYFLVEDVLTALQKLANHHRHQLKIPFIGITGSNGKTTTKELVNAVLSKKYKTLATAGNLNNQIGVPLTLLSIDESIEIAIIEMGASKVGDIQELCDIAEPTHGMITNIGKAHIEGFGGFEGVILGKSELYLSLLKNAGQVFINSQNPILNNMGKRFRNPLYYPAKGDFLHCEFISASPYIIYKSEGGKVIETNLLGSYNFENICAALCIGKFFDVSPDLANEAVKNYVPANNRSQLLKKGSNLLILDAYNANPNSMRAAIQNLKLMDADKKTVVLGDMYELGHVSEEEHRGIGELLKECNFNHVLLYGKAMIAAQKAFHPAEHFIDKEELKNRIRELNLQNNLVLIKASRSLGLESIVEDLN
ncbi:MAG: UDP-N-acetylmuramoyl-tripeptide--D-alanyl-D-alanine ligase [Bacteroidota bacterium]|nr:UDP-N-acetylmuramoyl-tripeptide--D-alanyl-D-alanine ligase [Bacteroidota bacterium]